MSEKGWRVLLIQSKSDLRCEDEILLVRQGEQTQWVPLAQLRILIIDTLQMTISTKLINELAIHHVKVIFCDEHHQPVSELCHNNDHTNTAGNLMKQIQWALIDKNTLWNRIVANKIANQVQVLQTNHKNGAQQLLQYRSNLNQDNATIVEGVAAKQYFVHLYGNGFCRRTDCEINQALNYGYSIILSQMSRSIVSYGYHTALGIEHHCESNSFNFSCDLMEPFRPIVDHYVYTHQDDLFTAETRKGLIALMYEPIRLDGKNMEVQTAIDLYVHNCIQYMNHECSTISEVTMIAT